MMNNEEIKIKTWHLMYEKRGEKVVEFMGLNQDHKLPWKQVKVPQEHSQSCSTMDLSVLEIAVEDLWVNGKLTRERERGEREREVW